MRDSERDTDINRLLDSVGEAEGVIISENSIETCVLLPYVQVRCMKQGTQSQCTGTTWGGMWERGSGWETHGHPWLIHVNVWEKPLQYCNVISLQLK